MDLGLQARAVYPDDLSMKARRMLGAAIMVAGAGLNVIADVTGHMFSQGKLVGVAMVVVGTIIAAVGSKKPADGGALDRALFPPPPRPDVSAASRLFGPIWGPIAIMMAWLIGLLVAAHRLGFVPNTTRLFFLTGWIPLAAVAAVAMHLVQKKWKLLTSASFAALALVTPILGTILIPSLGQLARTPLPGGPTLVASASPDGNANLYLVRGGGTQILKLTNTPASELMPDLSSDGHQIVYVSDANGTRDLHIMQLDSDGRPLSDRQITHDPSAEEEPRWSPDGTKVAFSVQTESGVDIAVIDADGSHLRYLTNDHTSMNPSWSPDGRWISFTRPAAAPPADDDIWTMRPTGSDVRDVVAAPGPQWGAVWSPDGRSFVFTATPNGNEDVMIARVDGTEIRDVTLGSTDRDIAYGWTPDGHVLFLSDRAHSGGTFLYFMAPDGSDVHLSVIL